tara:strand:+ start:9546 stop:10721 length:1176 start_codon:yes stop_codon:yes gene_type:complete
MTTLNKNSLMQGKQFKIMKTMFEKTIKNIGKSNYVGMKEGMEGEETTMQQLEREFRSTLVMYEKAQRDNLQSTMGVSIDKRKFYGKVVKTSDTNKLYYITTKGIYRELKGPMREPWNIDDDDDNESGLKAIATSHECPYPFDDYIIESSELTNFQQGMPLNYKRLNSDIGGSGDGYYWQKCPPLEGGGFGGHPWNNGGVFIIKDGSPGSQLAWLDHYGKKYNFKSGIKREDVHISFPKMGEKTYLIPSTEFLSNLPSGEGRGLMPLQSPELTKESPAPGIVSFNGDEGTSIISLNNKLIELAIRMRDEIRSVEVRNNDSRGASREINGSLDELIKELEKQRRLVKELKTEIVSLDKSVVDSHSMVKSINLRYFAWGLSLITVVLIGMKIKK